MSDFTDVPEIPFVFAQTEADTDAGFTAVADIPFVLAQTEAAPDAGFSPTGDRGILIITSTGFGQGGFGEGPFGGDISFTLSNITTVWTNITTP